MTNKRTYSEKAHDYARDVVSGTIIASKWIKIACQRHLDDLDKTDSRWFFNANKCNQVCTFIESLTLSDGSPFALQPFQVWLVASLMGWMDRDGTRKHIEALILIPKGNGKSPLAAALGLWFAFFDGRRKAEVYCGALSIAQAMEVFSPARDFIESQKAFTKAGIAAQKKSIFSASGSKFMPVIGRGRHGARPYLAILDELHQANDFDLYGTFKTGCNKTPNSLMLTISTAGVASTQSPCYQIQERAQKALDGSLPDERFFAAIYCADDTVEWSSNEALIMANPNLGISNDAEKLKLAIQSALRNPGEQNNTKAMHLNIWSTATSAWMNMVDFAKSSDPSLKIEDFSQDECILALDSASKLDLASIAILFTRLIDGKKHYYAFSRNYNPEGQVSKAENVHYQKWVKQGHLIATDGNAIDFLRLENDLIHLVKTNNVQSLCFDPAHGGYGTVQKVVSETNVTSVEVMQRPIHISPAMKELEAAVADGRFHYDGDPILAWCFSNIVTRESSNSLYKMPERERAENKIDAAMALFFALSRGMVIEVKPSASKWAFEPFVL
ncbi:terminase large subunit [Terriglobus roseus]|uniref:Phage terminase-like protein, large subunit, contains N-terminal HTH domain n=1 Tax=Terriglobus roseus TaxID=392734 RepID=A0A1G7G5N9_9BACT|nr:terminase TerL endonuclease subunit [Terriglobus roseus]SDE83417.1 Phage terminase-like protein, large subunit, contains N-terminal HTH domain [Terriglobus roseus]